MVIVNHKFTIKAKKIQHTIFEILQNLTRFHDGIFELELLEIFATVFLLKTIEKRERKRKMGKSQTTTIFFVF